MTHPRPHHASTKLSRNPYSRIFALFLASIIFLTNLLFPAIITTLPAPPIARAEESPPEATTSAGLDTPQVSTPAAAPLDPSPTISPLPTNSAQPKIPEQTPEATPSATPLPSPEPSPETPISEELPSPLPTPIPLPPAPITPIVVNPQDSELLGDNLNLHLAYPYLGFAPVTYRFGERSDSTYVNKMQSLFGVVAHDGVDFGVDEGSEVVAAADGTVALADNSDYGLTVILKHSWGTSYYGHLSEVTVVKGDKVRTGDRLGYSGRSGVATAPHLHFGIRPSNAHLDNGYHGFIDPTPYLALHLGSRGDNPRTKTHFRRGVFRLAASELSRNEHEVKLKFATAPTPDITISLKPPLAGEQDITDDVLGASTGPLTADLKVDIPPSLLSDPGRYTVTVNQADGSFDTADFYWGVLAVNADQDIYKPGDTATLALAVLDDSGEMVCDASLTLTVTDPFGYTTTKSTEDGAIKVNEEVCKAKDLTLTPDYESEVKLNGSGTYELALTAETESGTRSLSSKLLVQASAPYRLTRRTITRVYPAYSYPVTLEVTPTAAYQGLVTEVVPRDFAISPSTSATSYSQILSTDNGDQQLVWSVNWEAGKTYELGYNFDAPDKSPALFGLGPLTIGDFSESRTWALAIDAPTVIRLSPTVLITGSSWQVPSDWSDSNNTIEVIGGGGGGEDNGDSGGGGGGGAYSKSVNIDLTPGDIVSYNVGQGGSSGAGQDGGDGGDTYFCNSSSNCASIADTAVVVGAKGGSGAGATTDIGGSGGAAGSGVASGTGNTKYSGGTGGNGNGTGDSGGGGGGSAGPNGNGCGGGNGNTSSTAGGGGGGGGAGGGSCTAGSDGTSTVGGAGGNGQSGTSGGSGGNASNGGNGSNGSGGGGSDNSTIGGTGGAGTEWTSWGGGGGGGGGSNGDYGGDGGAFGGGGGGGENQGGQGARGIIIITYASKTPGSDTWVVPSDWNDTNNTLEVIGGGGAGYSANQNSGSAGGGGGGYSKSVNVDLTGGATVGFEVGRAGFLNSVNGSDSYLCNSTSNCASIGGTAVVVGAKGGTGATSVSANGVGGAAASGVASGTGNIKTSGGNGGDGNNTGDCGGGGGGAGGPAGDGELGGGCTSTADQGGGGGGGAGGASSTGGSAGSATGGDGGAGPGGTGGGAGGNGGAGANGTDNTGGGGGGGDDASDGGAGGDYDLWSGTGPGGGGGGAGDNTSADARGGAGGEFGGGGGGGVFGGVGSRGIIVATYTPVAATITISGTANGNSGASVRYAYDGVLQTDTSDTISGGTWSIDSVTAPSSDQIITVWVDNVSDANESTAVTKWSSGDVTGMVLDTNIVTVGSSEDTSLTLTNLNTYDCSEDEDIMYQAASSTLKVEGDSCAGSTTNSYSAEELEILSGDTLTVGGSETLTTYDLTITGTLTSGGNSTYNVAHNWAKTGTFTQSTSTVNLNGAGGTTQTLSGTTTFYTLSATGSSARTIKFPSSVTTTVSNSLTLTGASSQLLTLAPGTAATTWTLSAPSTTSVSYVSMSYSTSSGSSFCATSSTDGGNNASWLIATGASCQDGSYSFQRKTWYDGTRYWRSYYDTTDGRIEFEYSTDGNSWTENTSARIASSSVDFSIEADSSNAFVVYTTSNDIRGRKASSYPGTGFSWGSEETVLNGTGASADYDYPVISRDSSSYVHVAARFNDGTYYYMQAIKEAGGTNDLPEDSADTVKSLGNIRNTNSNVYGILAPLTSQNMYLSFALGSTLAGCKWVNSSTEWQNSSGATCEDDPSMYSGLVGWWELEEAGDADRTDSSGNNNTLTESASDTVAQVTGKFGYGADLERDDTEYLAITDAAQTGLDLGVNFTLSAWLNVESDVSGGGTNQGVITRADSNGNWAYAMRTEDTSICGMINDTGYAGDGSEPCSTSSMFSLATWTLFTITYDGATMRLYKDGSEQTSTDWPFSTTLTPLNSSGSFELGRWGSQNGYYDGLLDDVRVYNRTLTASEISSLNNYDPSVAGSYDSIDTTPGNLQDSFSAVGDGSGNVYLTYIDDEATDQVSVRRYNGTSWGSAALVADAADNNDSYPTLTYDSTGSDLYAFWVDTSSSDIYYAKCDVSTNCDTAAEWDSEVAWQTSGTNTYVTSNYSGAGKVFAEWLTGGTTISWDDISSNTAPNSPSSLAQKTTGDVTLATGDWHNTTSIKFTATATDTDNPDTLQLCVEKDLLGTSFSNTEDSCGSGVSYSGSGVTVSVTLSSQTDASEYHWQARIKDAGGLYSSWVAYGGNAESARDYGLDTTAPTGGTVYDGTSVGSDVSFSDSSLSALSGNWDSFNHNVSGLSKYQYSLGTSAGATDVKSWTDNGTTASVTATGLTLQTNQMYFVNVRAVDNAGNTSSVVSSNGQLVSPSLSFTVGPSSLTFSNLNPGNSYTDSQNTTLSTWTNAYNGYVLRAFATDYLRSDSGNYTINDFSGGTYASPAAWGSNTGFGYTSNDTTIQGSDKFNGATLYAPFSQTSPGDIVADHTANVSGSPVTNEQFTITNKVTASATQAAHHYSTTIVYTATAQY